MKRILLLSLALSVLACSENSVTSVDTRQSSLTDTDVSAVRLADGIRLTNQSGKTIRFIAKNEAWLGLLAGCHHAPESCSTLASGQSVVIGTDDIVGYSPGAAVLEVWYWFDGSSEPAGLIRLPL